MHRLTKIATMFAVAGFAATAHAAPVNYYWTSRDVGTVNKTTSLGVTTQIASTGGSRAQDVDLVGNTLYFADWGMNDGGPSDGKILSVSSSGGAVTTVLTTFDAVHQLAVDDTAGKIYYTQGVSYSQRTMGVVDTNGANHTILLSEQSWFPSGLALDKANNKLYWGDIGVLNFPINGAVNVVNTDGTGATVLDPHVVGRGRGFALYNGEIYLTSHNASNPSSGGGIFKYNIAGDTLTQLISDTEGFWDIQIDEADQRMYWTSYATGLIESAALDGTDRQVALSGLTGVYGLALEFGEMDPVPEPATLMLMGTGLGYMARRVRRQRKAAQA